MVNINLLPPEIKGKIKKAKQSANVFSICLVAVIAFVVITFLLGAYKDNLLRTRLDDQKAQLQSANQELDNFNQLQNEALFLTDRGKLATQIESTRPNWSQILESMINSVPTSVQFTSLTADITKSPNFVLQGSTTSDREAIKFKDKLASSSFFKDVAFKSSTVGNQNENGTTNINFTLEFNLAQYSTKTEGTK